MLTDVGRYSISIYTKLLRLAEEEKNNEDIDFHVGIIKVSLF